MTDERGPTWDERVAERKARVSRIVAAQSEAADGIPHPADELGREAARPTPDESDYSVHSRIEYVDAADIKLEAVCWLWKGRVPAGKVSLIDGDPELGKSTIAVDIAARISSGRAMPGEDEALLEPSAVVIFSGEDGAADTLAPRLTAAGADMRNVKVVTRVVTADDDGNEMEREPSFPADLALVRELIIETGARLIVLDVLMSYLQGVKSGDDQEMRAKLLTPLHRIAEETGCGIVGLRHFRKSGRANPVLAGGGSIAIVGAARVANFVAADPDDVDGPRLFAVSKINIGEKVNPYSYRLVSDEDLEARGISAARVDWLELTDHFAGDLLNDEGGAKRDNSEDDCELLRSYLVGTSHEVEGVKVVGLTTAKDLESVAYEVWNWSKSKLGRIKKQVGVVSFRLAFSGGWLVAADEHSQSEADTLFRGNET